ncbi:MAG: esterase-like activity of phytase family protein [Aurantimonas endophytica]|uniref:Phytase-like domain-containing protein n=1 Tax=Aurantimonas endophytica TaxID=1522175 RepID=A0A7W6HGV4_9HYPH|nr:esterase-like activity of phytase family protein [Aurantimonas endophytica]MBB4005009.1 hypothetical protein [Aurantimonas endophytica]MCO6405815.1 hypothetical protein [Aurantimonas endophytica]
MIRTTLSVSALALAVCLGSAQAETVFPAKLVGHAFVPAATFVDAPADAPEDARISGKFTTGSRVDAVGTVPGDTGAQHGKRTTGLSVPFEGQPLQGFSGFAMERAEDGSTYVLTDNGFGTKANSPDALLFFHRVTPDFETGSVAVNETVFLSDPDKKIPFRIAYEGTEQRYLTGADFDPESIQLVDGDIWIGEEFGPYLIRATTDGKVISVHSTMMDGAELKSVDHPTVSGLSKAGTDWRVPRSGGYEGMALQPGTDLLWAMLEKPLLGEDGAPVGNHLQVLAFDPAKGEWTGEGFKLALAEGATAIGDFNFIDETRALVIERDNGEGDPSLKCEGEAQPDCFPSPAMLKRIVLVDTASIDEDGFVRRIGHIDLMDIADPDGKSRIETAAKRDLEGVMTFPFFTIENVMAVSNTEIMVAMDNNLPFSSGRTLDKAADNEFILLDVSEMLAAK